MIHFMLLLIILWVDGGPLLCMSAISFFHSFQKQITHEDPFHRENFISLITWHISSEIAKALVERHRRNRVLCAIALGTSVRIVTRYIRQFISTKRFAFDTLQFLSDPAEEIAFTTLKVEYAGCVWFHINIFNHIFYKFTWLFWKILTKLAHKIMFYRYNILSNQREWQNI